MEKLDLLSTTAILKQSVDGASSDTATAAKAPSSSVNKGAIVEAHSFGQSTAVTSASAPSPTNSVASSTISKPIFSVASSASVSGLLVQVQDSSIPTDSSAHKNSNHLASPVSADGEDEDEQNAKGKKTNPTTDSGASKASATSAFTGTLATSVITHSLQQIIESRSPVPAMDYRQGGIDGPSPPSYGYGLHTQYIDTSAFTSIGGAAMGTVPGFMGNFPQGAPVPGLIHHHQQDQRQLPSPHPHGHKGSVGDNLRGQAPPSTTPPTYEEMAQELAFVKNQLKEKDMVVSSLQHRVNFLENQINELRQLPTGKISHIPVE